MRRLLLLALPLFLSACGGDKEGVPTTSPDDLTTLATRALPTASDVLLESALLTPDDLGGAWRRESAETAGATVGDAEICGETVKSLTPAAAAIYGNTELRVVLMFQAIVKFENEDEAHRFMEEYRHAYGSCDSITASDGVRSTTWEIRLVDFPEFGDEQVVMNAKANIQGVGPTEGYWSTVRYGNTIVSVSPAVVAPASTQDFEAIFEAADNRFRRVVGTY